jgi:hypothetical protein
MSEQRTASATPSAAGVKGRLRVGDHVGLSAGQAAQAIRRAGLRPGLERCLGYPEQQTGLVVEQDPPAGTELARNALVRIYVAAPGGEPQAEQDDEAEVEQAEGHEDAPSVEFASEAGSVEFDAQPDDADAAELGEAAYEPAAAKASEPAAAVGEGEAVWLADERSPQAPSEEQLLALAQRVFAERAGRRPRPRMPGAGSLLAVVRRRLAAWRRRSVLVKGAWAMLALWLAVGLITALIGGRHEGGDGRREPTVADGSPRARQHPAHRGAAAGAAGFTSRRSTRTSAPSPRRSAGQRERARADERATARRRRAIERQAAAGARVAAPQAPRSSPAESSPAQELEPVSAQAPGVAVPAPEPEPEQVGGGPFSP